MKEDLWARFGRRFIDTARARVARVEPLVATGAHEGLAGVVHEMHSLAGEASMLGVAPVAELARRVEIAAKKWGTSQTNEDAVVRAACASALGRLGEALDKLTSPSMHP